MALPTLLVTPASSGGTSVNTLPPGGQAAGASSLPVVLATDDPVVLATGAKADAPYADATGAAAGGIVALLKALVVRLLGLLTVDAVSHATANDRSGTITAGGTAQQLMAQNASRRGWAIQNLSSGDLWINGLGTAAASQPSMKIPAGAYWETGAHCGTGAISIFGATSAQAFYSREWN